MDAKKILNYVSAGATVLGIVANLLSETVAKKKTSMEIQEAVAKELAKQRVNPTMKRDS